MSRRPRGNCPVCRNTLSLRWSGDIRVLRKHSVIKPGVDDAAEPCVGSGRPAVGELTELHAVTRPGQGEPLHAAPAQAGPAQTAPAQGHPAPERVASVA